MFNVDGHSSAKLRRADIIFGFEFNANLAQSDKVKVHDDMNVRLKVDRSRDVDSDGNLDSILFFGSSVFTVIDNFTDDLFPGHVLKSDNASYTGADADTAIASEAFSTLDGGGKRRDYLIGRDNTADDLVIDLRDVIENTDGKSKTTDATRFTKADVIYNFDTTAGASQDKNYCEN